MTLAAAGFCSLHWTMMPQYVHVYSLQAEHPLLWGAETVSWLKGSPMAQKLASRALQVQQDAQVLIRAGANELFVPTEGIEDLVSDLTAKWAAATLLSRAFHLDIPIQNLNGVHQLQSQRPLHLPQ
jgi:hypothetical protein